MQHPPIVNVDTIASLIRQQRITRNGTPNKRLVACAGFPSPRGKGGAGSPFPIATYSCVRSVITTGGPKYERCCGAIDTLVTRPRLGTHVPHTYPPSSV
jgi:hypothetical protein